MKERKRKVMNEYEVKHKDENKRIDKLLTELNSDYSRSQIKGWIDQSRVDVNKARVKANYRVRPGDVVTWTPIKEKSIKIQAENIPLDIVFEDQDVLVVN